MARIFSRDPLSWGQIVFLWLGGALVVAPVVVIGLILLDRASTEDVRARQLQTRAAWHAEGRFAPGEYRGTRPLVDLSFYREFAPSDTLAERLDAEHVADSLRVYAITEGHYARRHVRAARHARVGAGLALLLAAGVVGLLIVRSFHAAARGPEGPRGSG
jgi:hypothetical protein